MLTKHIQTSVHHLHPYGYVPQVAWRLYPSKASPSEETARLRADRMAERLVSLYRLRGIRATY